MNGKGMNDKALQKHILSTYNRLRLGMGFIAAATPVVIPLWGWLLFSIDWQNSISAYYFAPLGNKWDYSAYPCRVLFVGVLFALGSFLYLYKGFSLLEDVLLNFAGAFAVGVAMFPMYAQPGYFSFSNRLHGTFAVLLFACMAGTAIFCADNTLRWVADPKRRARYRRTYYIIGAFMVLFPVIALLLAVFSDSLQRYIYWAEFAGIETFAAYWFVKSRELTESEAELRAVTARFA